MLETCGQIAAGLGAVQKGGASKDDSQAEHGKDGQASSATSVGNAPLGLWVGQRFLGMIHFSFVYPLMPIFNKHAINLQRYTDRKGTRKRLSGKRRLMRGSQQPLRT